MTQAVTRRAEAAGWKLHSVILSAAGVEEPAGTLQPKGRFKDFFQRPAFSETFSWCSAPISERYPIGCGLGATG